MFPLTVLGRDKSVPKAALALIVINLLVFLWELSVDARGDGYLLEALRNYGLEVCKIGEQSVVTTTLDSFRSLFLHSSIAHVLANMWFLYLFGGIVERYLGSVKFALAYPRLRRSGDAYACGAGQHGMQRDGYGFGHRRERRGGWRDGRLPGHQAGRESAHDAGLLPPLCLVAECAGICLFGLLAGDGYSAANWLDRRGDGCSALGA